MASSRVPLGCSATCAIPCVGSSRWPECHIRIAELAVTGAPLIAANWRFEMPSA
jgi:hypothetical protein